jgi:hypothetical protein
MGRGREGRGGEEGCSNQSACERRDNQTPACRGLADLHRGRCSEVEHLPHMPPMFEAPSYASLAAG